MRPYKVLVTHEVLSLPRPSVQDRNRILPSSTALAPTRFRRETMRRGMKTDRPVQIKVIGKHALTFWADHAVREVQIVRIEGADRK